MFVYGITISIRHNSFFDNSSDNGENDYNDNDIDIDMNNEGDGNNQ